MQKTGFEKLVLDALSRVQEMTIEEVAAKLKTQSPFFLIDVREENEWVMGHLPQAMHLCKGIAERDIEKLIPDYNQEIILYCAGGNRSVLVADNFQKMGYRNVVSMKGGYRAWKASEFPLVGNTIS